MKKTVWTFGLISGAILSVMMLITMPLHDQIGDNGEIVGYTTMVLAFLLIFFGVRSYRDQRGGSISFGRAFLVGVLITAVSAACYVATWEVLYHTVYPDYMEKYEARMIEKTRASGASQAAIDKQLADMKKMTDLYKSNLLFNLGVTFLEPLPVGLVMTLITAGVLRTRKRKEEEALAVA